MKLLLLILLMVSACDAEPVATTTEPSAPPLELQFPIDSRDTRFMFFNRDGRGVVKSDPHDVPEHVRPFTMVLLEKSWPPEGEAYLWEPGDDDARLGSAKRVPKSTLVAPSVAAWAGRDLGLRTLQMTLGEDPLEVEIEGFALPEPPRPVRGPAPAEEARPRKIEIVGITDGSPPRRRGSSRASRTRAPSSATKPTSSSSIPTAAGTRQWKSVTLYYDMSCNRCRSAMRWMDRNHVSYNARSLADANEKRRMQAALGPGRSNASLPVLIIGSDRTVMTGWDSQKFTRLAER